MKLKIINDFSINNKTYTVKLYDLNNNLIKVFKKMRDEIQGTIVAISHQERILNISNKIIMMKNGSIDKIGNNAEEN